MLSEARESIPHPVFFPAVSRRQISQQQRLSWRIGARKEERCLANMAERDGR